MLSTKKRKLEQGDRIDIDGRWVVEDGRGVAQVALAKKWYVSYALSY